MVHDPVLFTRRRHSPLPGAEHPFFSSDSKFTLTFKHQVDLILFAMDMALLFLSRFETIDVAEKPRRFKNIVLLHLLRTKLVIV